MDPRPSVEKLLRKADWNRAVSCFVSSRLSFRSLKPRLRLQRQLVQAHQRGAFIPYALIISRRQIGAKYNMIFLSLIAM